MKVAIFHEIKVHFSMQKTDFNVLYFSAVSVMLELQCNRIIVRDLGTLIAGL